MECGQARLLPGELELQARWYSGEFGRDFTGTGGECVRVVQFGVWNRSAGPDFVEAAVSIGGGEPLAGAIELDPDARDWERHGHGNNRAFEDVVLHVFWHAGRERFFTRTRSHRQVVQIQLAPPAIGGRPACVECRAGRCARELSGADAARIREILGVAAARRFERKAASFQRTASIHGAREALYQTVAAGMGYAGNELAFRLLAQRLPVGRLLADPRKAEALLFGVSGFLPGLDFHALGAGARSHVRGLWEHWWTCRGAMEGLRIPTSAWSFGGQRPANHPQRRVAALAAMVAHWRAMHRCALRGSWRELQRILLGLRHAFWDTRYTFQSRPAARRLALVGSERWKGLLLNAFLPAIRDWEGALRMLVPERSSRLRVAAGRILAGRPDTAALLKQAIHQQGLLEMYEVYCRQDVSDCERCPFPEQHPRWGQGAGMPE